MKTLKSDIFYAMNEINDKYILEAAQCLEQKKENDISLQKNSKLFHESNAHSRKRLARVATAMAVSIILFTTHSGLELRSPTCSMTIGRPARRAPQPDAGV